MDGSKTVLTLRKCPVINKIRWMAGNKRASMQSIISALLVKAVADLETKRGAPFGEAEMRTQKQPITVDELL